MQDDGSIPILLHQSFGSVDISLTTEDNEGLIRAIGWWSVMEFVLIMADAIRPDQNKIRLGLGVGVYCIHPDTRPNLSYDQFPDYL